MIKKILKVTLISATLLTLAACSTASKDGADNGAYGANASGTGNMTSFDGANGHALQVGNQSYYFDFNENTVHDSDMASIKVQADYLNSHPRAKVLLTGNTDERGSREYNIGLGDRRARAVAAVLEADGVNQNQITTVSYGAEKPVALGHDATSWAQNRRVDLIYQG